MPDTAKRGPGRPPAAKAAETRERIIRAAREVFSELGYEAATFQAIAIRSDLTRPAINHYFTNKRTLYDEVLRQTNELVAAAGLEYARKQPTLVGRLEAFLKAGVQVDSLDRSAAAFLVTAVLEAHRHPELAGEQDPFELSRSFVSWAVNEAIKSGELSTESDVPALVEMLLAVLWGVGFYTGFVGGHADLEAVTKQLRLLLSNKLWELRS